MSINEGPHQSHQLPTPTSCRGCSKFTDMLKLPLNNSPVEAATEALQPISGLFGLVLVLLHQQVAACSMHGVCTAHHS